MIEDNATNSCLFLSVLMEGGEGCFGFLWHALTTSPVLSIGTVH